MKAVSPAEVRRIAAIENPVLRNLEITYAYSRLAAALAPRGERGSGELVHVRDLGLAPGRARRSAARTRSISCRTGCCATATCCTRSRPSAAGCCGAGCFDRGSRLGRLMGRLHTPFDAVELASDAVARGNRKVFEEIGYEFARYLEADDLDAFLAGLRDGDPPDGQRCCAPPSRATPGVDDPGAQAMLLANLEIGLHEQTRLQPEIREAMDAAYIDQGGPRPAAVPERAARACAARPRRSPRRPSARSTHSRAS